MRFDFVCYVFFSYGFATDNFANVLLTFATCTFLSNSLPLFSRKDLAT